MQKNKVSRKKAAAQVTGDPSRENSVEADAVAVCRRLVAGWDTEETVWVGCVEDARAVLAKVDGVAQAGTSEEASI